MKATCLLNPFPAGNLCLSMTLSVHACMGIGLCLSMVLPVNVCLSMVMEVHVRVCMNTVVPCTCMYE